MEAIRFKNLHWIKAPIWYNDFLSNGVDGRKSALWKDPSAEKNILRSKQDIVGSSPIARCFSLRERIKRILDPS
jgi:hypothetical protein